MHRYISRLPRVLLLTALAVLLGLAGGAAAWALLRSIGLLTNLSLRGVWAWGLPPSGEFQPSLRLVIAPVLGALAVGALARWSPIIRGHGIPEAMESVLLRQSRIAPRAAIAKPLSAVLAIGTGGPFGAEGPIIVTGGALGSLLGQVIPVSPAERKILLAAGAAAGMAATFGAPLASIVLAFELLLFEFSPRALIPVATAAAVAGGMHIALFGGGPLFVVPAAPPAGLGDLPMYAALGVACGLVASVVSVGLFRVEDVFRHLPVGEFWHPALGAAAFGTLGLLAPQALGVGYDMIGTMLLGHVTLSFMVATLVAKLVLWWIALGSGTSGGTLAPLLLIGSAFGAMVATGANQAFGLDLPVTGFALVAMASIFGASTGAALTAVVFVFELTQDYQIALPLILATVLSTVVSSMLTHETLMTEKLTRRGVRVIREFHADPLQRLRVRDVMSSPAIVLPEATTVSAAIDLIAGHRHGAFPVVDPAGRLVGIISRSDLLAARDLEVPVHDVASVDVVTIAPDAPLFGALRLIVEERVEHLPVVDGDRRVLGLCTRTDVLRGRALAMAEERREPSVLARTR